ncbi:hypothetical protein AB0M22_44385 [Nocardia sp. NPDC051756]|uniref:hypothetical protein n=1 Tax=Nocardia sp. NPDC051756 TaxID=3154751 RepID=UPI003414146A
MQKYIGTKKEIDPPESQFQVSVVDKLKGNLPATVVVERIDIAGKPVISVGTTYLFVARYNAEKKWLTITPGLGTRELVGADAEAAKKGRQGSVRSQRRTRGGQTYARCRRAYEAVRGRGCAPEAARSRQSSLGRDRDTYTNDPACDNRPAAALANTDSISDILTVGLTCERSTEPLNPHRFPYG